MSAIETLRSYVSPEPRDGHVRLSLDALEELYEAAKACVTLEYDPARHEEINLELGRRADVLRAAVRRVESGQ